MRNIKITILQIVEIIAFLGCVYVLIDTRFKLNFTNSVIFFVYTIECLQICKIFTKKEKTRISNLICPSCFRIRNSQYY